MDVSRICLCRVSRLVRVFVSSVRAVRRSEGRVRVAEVTRSSATVGRDDGDGLDSGEAMVQRCVVSMDSCAEMAEAIMSMLSRKVVTSPERMSRSEGSSI